MRRFVLISIVCVTLLVTAACAPKREAPQPAPPSDAALVSALAGRVWVAESIHGQPVVDRSHTSMIFTTNGEVRGRGGCNAYSGSYTLEKGRLSFSPLAATMRMCAPALGKQETRFFQSLAEPHALSFKDELLYLTPKDGKPSVFAVQELD